MNALTLVMTTAGLGRFTAAQAQDDIDLTIAQVGFTSSVFVPAPTLTALPGEHRRIGAISGQAIGDNIVHMIIRDDAALSYQVRGFGLFLADGTLFAVYGQQDLIVEKTAATTLLMPLDIAFPTAAIDKLVFGDTNFLNPPATTVTRGIVELATAEEAIAGTDPARVAPLAAMKAAFAFWLAAALDARLGPGAPTEWAKSLLAAATAGAARTTLGLGGAAQKAADFYATSDRRVTGAGLVTGGGSLAGDQELTVAAATAAEVKTGTAADRAITPAGLRAAFNNKFEATGWRVHPDGFVEQWGLMPRRSTEGAIDLVFPMQFPNACFGVSVMTLNTNQTTEGQTSIQEVALATDRASLFAQNHTTNLSELGGYRWRAWGY